MRPEGSEVQHYESTQGRTERPAGCWPFFILPVQYLQCNFHPALSAAPVTRAGIVLQQFHALGVENFGLPDVR